MILFNRAAADQLASAADTLASRLRSQSSTRESIATQTLENFSGGHARAFQDLCVAESESRGKLAGVLEDLIPQLDEVKLRYEEEQARQDLLAAWWDRESARLQRYALGASTTMLFEPWDPKPSEIPITPRPIVAASATTERTLVTTGSGSDSGMVSGDPVQLRNFVVASRLQDRLLEDDIAAFSEAWANFTASCSWVPVDNGSVLIGLRRHLETNERDAVWVQRIAEEFASIAGHSWNWLDDNLSITPHDGMPTGWAWGTWGVGHLMTATGVTQQIQHYKLTHTKPNGHWLPKWMTSVGKRWPASQRFISRATDFHGWNNPNPGQFVAKTTWPTSKRGRFFLDLGNNRVANRDKGHAVRQWGKVGKVLGPAGALLTGGIAGYDQWQQDAQDPNMRTAERVGRTAAVGGAVTAGAFGGAALGATIGSAIPGVGTVIGGVLGGIIGGVAGSTLGQKIGDSVKDLAGQVSQRVADGVRDLGTGIADSVKSVGNFFGGVFSKS